MHKINIYTGKEPAKELRLLDEEIRRICSTLSKGEYQTHIVDADGTLADATTKINAILVALENRGILETS